MIEEFLGESTGEIAALFTAWCWVFTSLSFAAAGRRIGATAVNLIRLQMAVVMLAGIHLLLYGTLLPGVGWEGLIYLALSGIIGLSIGDQFLFTALVDVGPRISTLLMTFAPVVTTVIAWPVLDEPITLVAAIGIAMTLSGVIWVVLERPRTRDGVRPRSRHHVRGVIFGFLAATCQATGLVLTKLGIGHTRLPVEEHLDTWSATFIRMIFGASAMFVLALMIRRGKTWRQVDRTIEVSPEQQRLPETSVLARLARSVWPGAIMFTFIGAVFGPVFGVWGSVVAVDRTDAGIAATLMAMSPVFILPFAFWIEKERISLRAVLGALIAVAGVGVVMLSP